MPLNPNPSSRSSSFIQAVQWSKGKLLLLNQTILPREEQILECQSTEELIDAIKKLIVRGAPAIGIAGAYGVVLAAQEALRDEKSQQIKTLKSKLKEIELARPTAVNLSWAVRQMQNLIEPWILEGRQFDETWIKPLLTLAQKIHQDDIQSNQKIAEFGSSLLSTGPILTICNTGWLATGGVGTAFGVINLGYQQAKVSHVFACETRPVLQGARLTTWELNKAAIPYTLICDNMAAWVMRTKKVAAVIVGADRIARNGDVANKIGTYSLAVLAKAHSIPFFVAAPTSTFDLSLASGDSIPIEERSHEEVVSVLGENKPPFQLPVWNPAFDTTPNTLISAIISERGVIKSPNSERVLQSLGMQHE